MAGDQQKQGSFWTSMPVVLTAIAGIATGTASLLVAIDAFGGDDDKSEPTAPPTSSSAKPLAPTTTPTPTQSQEPGTAAIDLIYPGDAYGCSLFVQVEIADVTVSPQGLRHTIRDLPVGRQDYRVSGQIMCPTIGNCEATGEGKVMVQEGREYILDWRIADIGECTVSLVQ